MPLKGGKESICISALAEKRQKDRPLLEKQQPRSEKKEGLRNCNLPGQIRLQPPII
jgi:hypothetical protein